MLRSHLIRHPSCQEQGASCAHIGTYDGQPLSSPLYTCGPSREHFPWEATTSQNLRVLVPGYDRTIEAISACCRDAFNSSIGVALQRMPKVSLLPAGIHAIQCLAQFITGET